MGNGCRCLNYWWVASFSFVVSSVSVLCYISKNDFWDDSKTFIFIFLYSSELQWSNDHTLHADTQHNLRWIMIIISQSSPLPANILDVWQTSVTSSPPKRSVLDCASACQVSRQAETMLWQCCDNVVIMLWQLIMSDKRGRGQWV